MKSLHAFKDALIISLIGFIFILALFTMPLPTPLGAENVGAFQFVAFPTGFAFYQNVAQSHFYSLSPLDDFIVDTQGNKSTLASLAQLQGTPKSTSLIKVSSARDVVIGLENYFAPADLTYQSNNSYFPATYSAHIDHQNVTIVRQVTNAHNQKFAQSGMTLKFGNDDFVFDQNGQLYTNKNVQDVTLFNQFYGMNILHPLSSEDLTSINDDRSQLPDQITIANPQLNDLLVVTARANQTLWINRISNAIEVVEGVSDPSEKVITSSIAISVVSRPGETK